MLYKKVLKSLKFVQIIKLTKKAISFVKRKWGREEKKNKLSDHLHWICDWHGFEPATCNFWAGMHVLCGNHWATSFVLVRYGKWLYINTIYELDLLKKLNDILWSDLGWTPVRPQKPWIFPFFWFFERSEFQNHGFNLQVIGLLRYIPFHLIFLNMFYSSL